MAMFAGCVVTPRFSRYRPIPPETPTTTTAIIGTPAKKKEDTDTTDPTDWSLGCEMQIARGGMAVGQGIVVHSTPI